MRVALPGDQGIEHGPAGDTEDVADHRGQLDLGVFEEFPGALLFPVRSWVKVRRQRVRSRSWRCGRDGMKLGRSMPRSASLHSHTASSLSSPN
jgi:hypothetical protein